MNASRNTYKNVDDYIARSSVDVQDKLNQIRAIIKKAAPDATEGIAYEMPAYKKMTNPWSILRRFKITLVFMQHLKHTKAFR